MTKVTNDDIPTKVMRMQLNFKASIAPQHRPSPLSLLAAAFSLFVFALTLTGCNALVSSAPPSTQQVPITLQAATTTVAAGGVDMFTAMQQSTPITSGQWSVAGPSSNGTIDATGLYHAPSSIAAAAPVTIIYALGTQTSSITVTVATLASIPITVQAAQLSVQVQGSDVFTASQQGTPVLTGQWVVLGGSSNGTIDASGNYTAPSSLPSPATITVGYILGNSISTAVITVVDAAPSIASVSPGQLNQLASTVEISGSGFLPTSTLSAGSAQVVTTYVDSSHLSASITLSAPLNTTLPLIVTNPGNGFSQSAPYNITTVFPVITIQPSTLVGGPITLAISGTSFTSSDVVTLNGSPLITTVNSATSITATGFLTPWTTGSAVVQVAAGDGTQPIAAQLVPIQPTPVSYDAASRFSTQAAMGPRPDVVQSIQNLGFDAWMTQQFAQPPIAFSLTANPRTTMVDNALFGNSLLRQRLALALESFLVPQQVGTGFSIYFFEDKMEQDSSGNFRQMLEDIASDPNITQFLNLPNNQAATSPLVQPNQNFARELMQLFTIGPFLLNDDGSQQLDAQGNPIPTYTQDTVIDLTRAMTGWTYATPVNLDDTIYGVDYTQSLVPLEWAHDPNAKLLFGSVILPAGQTTTQDREMVLDTIFNHPNVPPFISHLLIQRLVKSDPSPAYIQRISTVFENNGSGVRGDLSAVVRAIMLDPEARIGDTTPQTSDGFVQEPYLWQMSVLSVTGIKNFDDQIGYIATAFGENIWNANTVFGFFSPSYVIPGTTINSPEFQLLNNLSVIQKSGYVWQVVSLQAPGGAWDATDTSWLLQNFTTVPAMVDALNHLVYHGQMSSAEQAAIINYCAQLNPFQTQYQLQVAIFLALNADSYTVSQ